MERQVPRPEAMAVIAVVAVIAMTTTVHPTRADASAPYHITADVVSADAQSRMLLIDAPDGRRERLFLDDQLPGPGGVRAGDRVILTLVRDPGRTRVTSILARGEAPAPGATILITPGRGFGTGRPGAATGARPPVTLPGAILDDDPAVREAYAQRVATLAQRANRVDAVWLEFQGSCDVSVAGSPEGARPWLGLWDGRVKADLSSGTFRHLFNQVVGLGSAINEGMADAEEFGRRALLPGTMREIRRRHGLDWSAWGSPAPKPLEL
jgi:hypothetical protein